MSSFRRMLARLKAHIDDTSAHQGVNLTASRAVVTNALGNLSASSTTSTEIGYVNGVTSAIQTQLDSKQATITGGATTIDTEDLTFDRALISSASGKVAVSVTSATELSYVDGVTSAIQTQLDAKASSTHNHTTANLTGFQVASGRLTLLSGTAVSTTDQLAKTTIYFTPYKGDRIGIYDGSLWNIMTFAEISVSVPATTNTLFDIFAYNNAGTLTLETTNWTNDTTRATPIVLQNGVYVKSGATTRRYLGTGRTTGVSGETEDSYKGNHQSGGRRLLWNYYNRVIRHLAVIDTTVNWTYTTATWRAANGGTTTNLVNCVIGVAEDVTKAFVHGQAGNPNAGWGVAIAVGVGVDSTNTNSAKIIGSAAAAGGLSAQEVTGTYFGVLAAGYHYLAWLEISDAYNTTTWQGDADLTFWQNGLQAEIMA